MGCKENAIDGIIAGIYGVFIIVYLAIGCQWLAIWETVSLVPFLFLLIIMPLCSRHLSLFRWVYFFWTLVCLLGPGIVFFKAKTDVEQVMDLYPLCELINQHR